MAKLSQAAIKAKADEWASYKRKIERLELSKTDELAEFEEQYRSATKEITDAYEPKLKVLRDKASAIEVEVIEWLTAHNKAITISGELANAVNETKKGNRVVDPRKFFELAKDKFFDCVTVGVKKAEEVLGKNKVNSISDKPESLVPSLVLK
jgi:hypothetical protein